MTILKASLLVVLLVALAIGVYVFSKPSPQQLATADIATLKCPEDYSDVSQAINALANFMADYFTLHPEAHSNANLFSAARIDFLISHNCTTTLKNFGYQGGPITPQVRQTLLEAMMRAANGTST